MCTAVRFSPGQTYFGRTLDYEYRYGESVVITPRDFSIPLRHADPRHTQYSMIGIAHVSDGFPLYYDAMNEHGLAMAGLNFPENAVYKKPTTNKDNVTVFELIPWILGQCRNIEEARKMLNNMNLTDTPFSAALPVTPLHWMLADQRTSITLEATADGICVYDNPIGILTNNPPFPMQMQNLCSYLSVSAQEPINRFAEQLTLRPFSRGMGGIGLPGDLSSQSRFVRAAFTCLNAICDATEESAVTQFFHIMDTVNQTRGCCRLKDGRCEITIYTSCCSLDTCIYYYTTYENRQITAVDLNAVPFSDHELICYPLNTQQQIHYQNQ